MIEIKSAAEIVKMKKACLLSAGALKAAIRAIKPGVTTAHVDSAVKRYIESHGAKATFLGYGGFPGCACISINDTVIHGIPGPQVICEGDIVSVDVGAMIGGYTGDNAYTVGVGRISDEAKKLLEVTNESLAAGIAAAQPGNRIGDIAHAVQTVAEKAGYSVVRAYTGHGVGRNLHEDPEVPNFGRPGRGLRLVPGMTLAIEPMVNAGGWDVKVLADDWTVKTVDGSLSAHFEHTVLITANGPEILTL